ncbi:MAG: phosphosulfolactate synthase [Flavobacteriales bacterium]|nr:phosphosulfolactate synthase [Flavobacteriales bacterium]
MNFELDHIPLRHELPRQEGLTMVMDKGISLREAQDFNEVSAPYTDFLKLGFGTSYLTSNLKEKIKLYKDAGMMVYVGGTLFEAFVVRGKFDEFRKMLDDYGLNCAEVSDGSIVLPHDEKLEYIHKLKGQVTVVSEVGSKEAGLIIHPSIWITMMNAELEAGSFKVIAEAREGGNVGIFRSSGNAHTMLVNKILDNVPQKHVIWEAPKKEQQVYFIKLLGSNVNLGNIAVNEVIPLETLRLGLRGDTFLDYLPADIQKKHDV